MPLSISRKPHYCGYDTRQSHAGQALQSPLNESLAQVNQKRPVGIRVITHSIRLLDIARLLRVNCGSVDPVDWKRAGRSLRLIMPVRAPTWRSPVRRSGYRCQMACRSMSPPRTRVAALDERAIDWQDRHRHAHLNWDLELKQRGKT
jgi:hypothetical protein